MNDDVQLPAYRCHKVVSAAKIKSMSRNMLTLVFPDGDETRISITSEWCLKHKPESGGYYVKYVDGYTSYSPAEAFEAGYTLMEPEPVG